MGMVSEKLKYASLEIDGIRYEYLRSTLNKLRLEGALLYDSGDDSFYLKLSHNYTFEQVKLLVSCIGEV